MKSLIHRLLFLVALFLVLGLFLQNKALSLSSEKQERWLKNTKILLQFNPKYRLGYQDKQFANCSGSLFEIGFDSGFPVLRTTAWNMAHGADGWKSKVVSIYSTIPSDILFWHIYDYYSHVGTQTGKYKVAHASSTKGFVEVEFEGWAVEQLALARRLTFGD